MFVGSVFSPYYAWAGRRDPEDHVAVNIALYGPGGNRWAMTERKRAELRRRAEEICIGPSSMSWHDGALDVALDEWTVPLPGRIRGRLRFVPDAVTRACALLDTNRRHVWWPIAPSGTIAVELDAPRLSWSGHGYLDSNWGSEPLEAGFRDWDWSRARGRDGVTVLYDVRRRTGDDLGLAVSIRRDGAIVPVAAPPLATLPATTLWRIPRATRSEAAAPTVRRTFEDTPFYARSLVETTIGGERMTAVHESLALDRFAAPIVKLMLPFRMPRL